MKDQKLTVDNLLTTQICGTFHAPIVTKKSPANFTLFVQLHKKSFVTYCSKTNYGRAFNVNNLLINFN